MSEDVEQITCQDIPHWLAKYITFIKKH